MRPSFVPFVTASATQLFATEAKNFESSSRARSLTRGKFFSFGSLSKRGAHGPEHTREVIVSISRAVGEVMDYLSQQETVHAAHGLSVSH